MIKNKKKKQPGMESCSNYIIKHMYLLEMVQANTFYRGE